MKIAIFSDIHGNKYALDAIIKSAKEENVDKIICLGDVMGVGPEPKECIDIIMNNDIEMIVGNHELYYLRGTDINEKIVDGEKNHHEWIKNNLEEKYYNYLINKPLKIEIDNMLFCHYLINDEKSSYPFYSFNIINNGDMFKMLVDSKYQYIFIGHYHEPFELEYNNKFIIDVGTSGCVKNDITSYVLYQNNSIERKLIKYDRDSFIKGIKNIEYPDKEFLEKNFFGIE